jgi:hypothetical protein
MCLITNTKIQSFIITSLKKKKLINFKTFLTFYITLIIFFIIIQIKNLIQTKLFYFSI